MSAAQAAAYSRDAGLAPLLASGALRLLATRSLPAYARMPWAWQAVLYNLSILRHWTPGECDCRGLLLCACSGICVTNVCDAFAGRRRGCLIQKTLLMLVLHARFHSNLMNRAANAASKQGAAYLVLTISHDVSQQAALPALRNFCLSTTMSSSRFPAVPPPAAVAAAAAAAMPSALAAQAAAVPL